MYQLRQTIGNINPQELTESRVQLHYAIQFIAAVGSALAEPQPDYSHTSIGWNPELQIFVGELIKTDKPFQVALDPVSLTSLILDEGGQKIAEFSLNQKTLEEGMNWHKDEIGKLGADADKVVFLSYPPDDFPDHAIAHGAPFDASSEKSGRQELANYYANTHQLLQEIVANNEGASPVHIWPHHFDIATLITLDDTKDGQPMTVGVGMSPGDTSYNEPYWYVSPYPYPKTENLPPVDGKGFWHTQHWVGAVLTASKLERGEAQQAQVQSFLDSAVEAAKTLLQNRS